MSDLDEYYAALEAELKAPKGTKAQQAIAKTHDNYLEKSFEKVAPVASKIHRELVKNSKRKPVPFDTEREFERILKIMLDVPEDFDVWLKKDDDLAVAEYRRKIQNIICQGALAGTLYLATRSTGTGKSDPAREKVSMFLINHFLGNPPQRIAVADVSTDVQEHFREIAVALERGRDSGEEEEGLNGTG